MPAADYNPFAKRSEFKSSNLLAYKLLTIITWLLVVVIGAYYNFNRPENHHSHRHYHTIWGQNNHFATPFSLNSVVTSIYWIVILILQAHYVRYLWSADKTYVTSSANVGSHFILHNLLTFGFIMLWVRGQFVAGEVLLIINLFNLTLLYFGHPNTPLLIHIPVVSAPLAWNYVAILWDGAAMVNAHSLAARVLANIVIWGILVLGAFFIVTFKDYTIGIELAILCVALAIAQIETHVIAFQWIFAIIIAVLLVLLSIVFSVPQVAGRYGKQIRRDGAIVSEDQERAPLLQDS